MIKTMTPITATGVVRTGDRSVLRNCTVLFLAILATSLFLFLLGPLAMETETLKPMSDFITENHINSNAYYYTDVEEFFEAERHMHEFVVKNQSREANPSRP